MDTLDSLFSSPSKVSVLRTLSFQKQPMPLRHISYLAKTSIYSVQRSLDQLLAKKIVKKQKQGHKVLFALEPNYSFYDFIKKIFTLEEQEMIQQQIKNYKTKPQKILNFTNSIQNLFHKIKK